jgi:hypothetical protein
VAEMEVAAAAQQWELRARHGHRHSRRCKQPRK